MKTVCLNKPYDITIKEKPIPQIKENEALIKIKAVGICGSDITAYKGDNKLISYPRILGHEVVGKIIKIKDNNKNLKIGDIVFLNPYISCGTCYACLKGHNNCCENLEVIGVHRDGGMSEYITYDINYLLKVPKNLKIEYVPLIEPLSVALHSHHQADIKRCEFVTIFGAGPIGLLIALVTKHYGAIPILVDILDKRLEKAKELGIKHTINFKNQEIETAIKNITSNKMSPVVIEASGANEAIVAAIKCVSYTGRIVLTGWPKKNTLFPTDIITKKELTIKGSRNSQNEFLEAIELMIEEKIPFEKIISKKIKLKELSQTIELLKNNPEDYLKIILSI